MGGLSFARNFRLRPGAIECDADGLRVGGVALLARDAKGAWTRRDEGELSRELSKLYGLPLDCERKGRGAGRGRRRIDQRRTRPRPDRRFAVAASRPSRLRGRPTRRTWKSGASPSSSSPCGLLKADADWDEKHPRTGEPPNPGWFAPTSGAPAADAPKTEPSPAASAPSRGGAALAFVSSAPAAGVSSLLAEDLSATALRGLATLAARFSAAAILFDAIFVPSDNRARRGGPPPRPSRRRLSLGARRNRNRGDAQGPRRRPMANPGRRRRGAERPSSTIATATPSPGWSAVPDQRQTLVATVGALDRAVADLRRKDGEPAAAPIANDNEPQALP